MAKALKTIINTTPTKNGGYVPKAGDEQKFVNKHVIAKHSDANGNDDDVFDGAKVKPVNRKATKHGYNAGDDSKVYEELEISEVTHEGAVRAASVWKNKGDLKRYQLYMKLAAALDRGDKTTASGFENQLRSMKEESELDEKLNPSMGAGKYVSDFEKSAAPQFAGKSKAKRRMMGVAAYLSAKKGGMKEEVEHLDENDYMKSVRRRVAKNDAERYKQYAKHDAEKGHTAGAKLYSKAAEHSMKKANEEIEQVDELDKSTMRSYVGKAAVDIARSGITQGMLKQQHKGKNSIGQEIMAKHVGKRLKGIDTATKKLAYEELDVSLLELFINLDEENRDVMLHMIDEDRQEELKEFALTIAGMDYDDAN